MTELDILEQSEMLRPLDPARQEFMVYAGSVIANWGLVGTSIAEGDFVVRRPFTNKLIR